MSRSFPLKSGLLAQAWLTNILLVAIGLALLLFTRQLILEFHHFSIGFSGVAGWSTILYCIAALIILTRPVNTYTFPIILIVGIACRIVTLLSDPAMSSDIYRYVWDGLVQHAHISPYRYVPGDPALTFLQEPHQQVFNGINRRDYAHTIYPPVAQMLFYLITFLKPTVRFMKLVMILFEGVTLFALVQLLREMGLPRERTLLYAWCPLLIWEIGSSGHLDSVAMAFVALALLARYRQKPIATGLLLGAAILIKFYPLVLFPALYRRGDYKMPAAFAAMATVCYAIYASVGMRVFGFLGGYVQEEGLDSGTRYFLLEVAQRIPGVHHLSVSVYLLLCAMVFVGITFWCWQTCCRTDRVTGEASREARFFGLPEQSQFLLPAIALAITLMLLFSPHYPWYVAWLVPFLVLLPSASIIVYTLGLFYLCATPLGAGTIASEFQLNRILYGAVLLSVILDWVIRTKLCHRWQRVESPA